MIRKAKCETWLEADTVAKTLSLVIEVQSADGGGDVQVHRVDLTDNISGPDNAAKRQKLRDVFSDVPIP